MNQLINHEGVCKTALAILGLLIIFNHGKFLTVSTTSPNQSISRDVCLLSVPSV